VGAIKNTGILPCSKLIGSSPTVLGGVMRERINKPRVFLSHSKADLDFIQRLYEDLRKCQIDPWLDSDEIRHGQPWMSAIFEDGLPTCDCVLVYLTENSIKSKVVSKEIDVGILQKLNDEKVGFLPYVSRTPLRSELRPDLQVLQAPEWNDSNYKDFLPRVVAEIWRSYLERTVGNAISAERVSKLEAQLELEKLKLKSGVGGFSVDEENDYIFIYNKLNRMEAIEMQINIHDSQDDLRAGKIKESLIRVGEVNVVSLLSLLSPADNFEYHDNLLRTIISKVVKGLQPDCWATESVRLVCKKYPNLGGELLMYGLISRGTKVGVTREFNRSGSGGILANITHLPESRDVLIYTDKIERFKYWMAFTGRLPQRVKVSVDWLNGNPTRADTL
jgi:hypothetical protein